jgi:hypothetical protein
MKRVFAGTIVAAAFAVGLSAQTTPPPAQTTPPQSQPMQEAKDAAKTVTVTGCLKAGEGTDTFILSGLKWTQDKAVGTAGATAPAITATELKLVSSASGTNLSSHVGHTVEVTGTIGDKADKADKPMASTNPPEAARPAPGASTQTSLNVRSLKMIAATCPVQ